MTPSDVSPSKAKKASQPKAKAEYLINREISWLKFNIRVLEEACNLSHPILERVRFLSISASNLDEFYMVRVAGLNARRDHKVDTLSNDGLTIDQQLKFIDKETKELIRRQLICWADLKKELYRQGVLIFEEKNLPEADTAFVERLFLREIAPALTPIIVDPEHPFPFIPNLGLALALKLKSHKDGKLKHALLPIPKVLERFTRLPDAKNEGGKEILRLIRVEKLIEIFLQDIFPHHDILGQGAFRVLRDTGLEIHEDAEDLVSSLEHALQKRGFGKVVRLTVEDPTPKELVDLISDELLDDKSMRAQIKGILGIRDLAELTKIDRPDLLFDPFEAQVPENLEHFREDCFAAIEKNDIVLHHPYESFDVVAEFLLQAARDPDVVAIKQTLYRTTAHSPIINALIEAANNGKDVTAVIEIKARFDEETNLRFARDLEAAGANVSYGFVKYKTHAKLSLVHRSRHGQLIPVCHLGTGNYHPINAKVYTDLSFFSANRDLCRDVAEVFDHITKGEPVTGVRELAVSPLDLRAKLLDLIGVERENARAGKPAAVWVKLNALVDPIIIQALYDASGDGVKIDLVVRGICCLRPGVPGLSENIRVKSIVGRFLEHSRVMCFGNGSPLPSDHAKVYISSADWMPRNFDRRVEVLVPIREPSVKAQVLDRLMVTNHLDNQQSWQLDGDGNYERIQPAQSEPIFNCHEFFLQSPGKIPNADDLS